MKTSISTIGKRGTLVIPAGLRKRFGIQEGAQVITEEREDGILIRPSVTLPIERYTPLRRAEFLLSNAVDEADYARAAKEVRRLGLDPASIPHHPPGPRRKPRKA
jgi:AbrB family looped-hinge helix DNA binding protein